MDDDHESNNNVEAMKRHKRKRDISESRPRDDDESDVDSADGGLSPDEPSTKITKVSSGSFSPSLSEGKSTSNSTANGNSSSNNTRNGQHPDATPVLKAAANKDSSSESSSNNNAGKSSPDRKSEKEPKNSELQEDEASDKKKSKRLHAQCRKCSNRFAYPSGYEYVRCPHCHEVVQVPSESVDEESKKNENEFYRMLGEFKTHFDKNNYALVWLARATPTRSWKLAVPKACRFPKANAGQGGYATAFRRLGLQLRSADTKSGHWHYWYLDPKQVDFKALQRALLRRCKESPNYSEQAAEAFHMMNSRPHMNGEDRDVDRHAAMAQLQLPDLKLLAGNMGLGESKLYSDKLLELRSQMRSGGNKAPLAVALANSLGTGGIDVATLASAAAMMGVNLNGLNLAQLASALNPTSALFAGAAPLAHNPLSLATAAAAASRVPTVATPDPMLFNPLTGVSLPSTLPQLSVPLVSSSSSAVLGASPYGTMPQYHPSLTVGNPLLYPLQQTAASMPGFPFLSASSAIPSTLSSTLPATLMSTLAALTNASLPAMPSTLPSVMPGTFPMTLAGTYSQMTTNPLFDPLMPSTMSMLPQSIGASVPALSSTHSVSAMPSTVPLMDPLNPSNSFLASRSLPMAPIAPVATIPSMMPSATFPQSFPQYPVPLSSTSSKLVGNSS